MADTITGELLEKAKKENEDAIKKNNCTPAEKAILNGQSIMYMFIEKHHERVEELYEAHKTKKKWVAVLEKLSIPVVTSLIIIFLSQAIYFWVELVPKLKALP